VYLGNALQSKKHAYLREKILHSNTQLNRYLSSNLQSVKATRATEFFNYHVFPRAKRCKIKWGGKKREKTGDQFVRAENATARGAASSLRSRYFSRNRATDESQARKNIPVDAPDGVRCQRVSISIDGSRKVRFTLPATTGCGDVGPERRMERGSETGGD
jgi:hypothetical protein